MLSGDIIIRAASPEELICLRLLGSELLPRAGAGFARDGNALLAEDAAGYCGHLLFGVFKDAIPFMHSLYVVPKLRGGRCAGELAGGWERLMRDRGYNRVMLTVSSLSTAQNFYRLLGYQAVGSFALPGEPLELVLLKELD